jgi:hypothetical protein
MVPSWQTIVLAASGARSVLAVNLSVTQSTRVMT